MSVQSEIERISGNVQATLTAVSDMGGTVPEDATSDDMASSVLTIPQGTSDYNELENKPITRIESTDDENLVNLRDLESGTYVLYGRFKPFSGSDSTITFSSELLVFVVKKTSTSSVQVLYPVNNCVQHLEITDSEYTRTNVYLNDLVSAINGTVTSENADYAEVGEWADGNPDGEDRIGYFVAVDLDTAGTTMVKAQSNSDVRGVTINAPAFSGGVSADKTDDSGNLLSQYNYVAVMGLVPVIDNGTCTINGRCMPANDGTAVPSTNSMGYQVIDRIDDTHVLIAVEPGADMLNRIKTDMDRKIDSSNLPAKTDDMTQAVGVDEAGGLWALPGGGDENREWRLLAEIDFTSEEYTGANRIEFTDVNATDIFINSGATQNSSTTTDSGYHVSINGVRIGNSYALTNGKTGTYYPYKAVRIYNVGGWWFGFQSYTQNSLPVSWGAVSCNPQPCKAGNICNTLVFSQDFDDYTNVTGSWEIWVR